VIKMYKNPQEYNMGSLRCSYRNCESRTFYAVRQRDFRASIIKNKKPEVQFRLMLICTKCGEPEVYGD